MEFNKFADLMFKTHLHVHEKLMRRCTGPNRGIKDVPSKNSSSGFDRVPASFKLTPNDLEVIHQMEEMIRTRPVVLGVFIVSGGILRPPEIRESLCSIPPMAWAPGSGWSMS